MFNRKSFGLLASLCLASASSPYISGMPTPTPDACTSACGSAASSSNPYGDMSNLLKSGINCPSPYNPLSSQSSGQNQYGYSGDSCIIPGYYPQQGSGSGYGYPGMNGAGTTPITGMSSNDECEVTTSIECKPKKGGNQNYFSPAYSSYSPNSSMIPMGNIIGGGSASTRPYTVPGSSQTCDCSQFMGGMTNGGYPSGSQPYASGSDGCNCSQLYGQNGISGQPLLGGNATSPTSGGLLPGQSQKQPLYCGSNSGSGCKGGQFDNSGFMGGRTPGSVFSSFDCCKSQTYQPSPIKTAIIGTTELPISDNFRATSSSCGPAPCF